MSEQTQDAGRGTRSLRNIAGRLYNGEAGLDVVGKRKIFYAIAGLIVLVALIAIPMKSLNMGIEFEGGNAFTLPASVGTLEDVSDAVSDAGAEVVTSQVIGGQEGGSYQIKTAILDPDDTAAATKAEEIKQTLAEKFNLDSGQVSVNTVSGAWGQQVTNSALIGAGIFLVVVMIYLALALREWRMAVAGLAALLQNLILTTTVYVLIGFEVTPSTVIGFLTILGFALYDVVVVFDKVRENTRGITGSSTTTYGEAANLAVNQTLMRSINTAVVALLPVGGLLFIGAGLLGAGTLKDLGLVLFVGMLVAVYSSIFLATPVLVDLKEQEPRFKLHKQRVLQRRAAAANLERKNVPSKASAKAAGKVTAGKAAAGNAAGKAASSVDVDTDDLDDTQKPVLAGTAGASSAPRAGARPQQGRKRSGGGAKPGGKPGGTRSGGRKR